MTSASSRNRAAAVGVVGVRSWISLSATSRFSSSSLGDEDLAEAAPGVRRGGCGTAAGAAGRGAGRPVASGRRVGSHRAAERGASVAWISGSATDRRVRPRSEPIAPRRRRGSSRRRRRGRRGGASTSGSSKAARRPGPAPALDQDRASGSVLARGPRRSWRPRAVARDEVHLQRQDAEEQVAVGLGPSHGRIPLSSS